MKLMIFVSAVGVVLGLILLVADTGPTPPSVLDAHPSPIELQRGGEPIDLGTVSFTYEDGNPVGETGVEYVLAEAARAYRPDCGWGDVQVLLDDVVLLCVSRDDALLALNASICQDGPGSPVEYHAISFHLDRDVVCK